MDAKIEGRELFQKIISFLNGEFDNFQQAWQENTEEDMHRIEVNEKHRHLHTVFKKHASSSENNFILGTSGVNLNVCFFSSDFRFAEI